MGVKITTLIILRKQRVCSSCGRKHMDAKGEQNEDGFYFNCPCRSTLFIPKHKDKEYVLHREAA